MARDGGSSAASRDSTIRGGAGGRHWYLIAGYVAFGGLGILHALFSTVQFGGVAGGTVLGVFLIGLALGGLVALVSLFKDSTYLRGRREGWSPRWWYYNGVPIGVALASFVVGSLLDQTAAAVAYTVILFGIAALVSSVWYLYNRHRFVGAP